MWSYSIISAIVLGESLQLALSHKGVPYAPQYHPHDWSIGRTFTMPHSPRGTSCTGRTNQQPCRLRNGNGLYRCESELLPMGLDNYWVADLLGILCWIPVPVRITRHELTIRRANWLRYPDIRWGYTIPLCVPTRPWFQNSIEMNTDNNGIWPGNKFLIRTLALTIAGLFVIALIFG